MNVNVAFNKSYPMKGKIDHKTITLFDSSADHGGTGEVATPMEILLQAAAACSMIDIMEIIRKKRKQVDRLQVSVEGERTETHPKIFTTIRLRYELHSPDAETWDLARAVELSIDKYCSVIGTLKKSGCEVHYESVVIRLEESETT
jgi:putative redox protein